MKTSSTRKTLLFSALTMTALLAVTGCGGGGDGGGSTTPPPVGGPSPAPTPTASPSPSPSPSPSASPSPPPVGNAANGKTLYTNNCMGCHGDYPSAARQKIANGAGSPNIILSAISNPQFNAKAYMQMSFLSATIGRPQAEDIAAYLANP